MEESCSSCGGPLAGGACEACGDLYVWPSEQADDRLLGTLLDGRYLIEELLSVGGMARLYRGVQQSLDRPVAVKVLPPRLLAGGDDEMVTELVTRFFMEAKSMSRLNHPNVVSVYDFGRMKDTGWLYMVMELLAGEDLFQVIHSEALSLVEIGNIVVQSLEALAEAHNAGITHRDIKPENIIVERRRDGLHHVKVIDFGVAKLGAGGAITRSGRIVGSPHYMSPEQARGEPVSPAADLYSVGVLLFELLTGRVPFEGRTALEILTKLQTEPVPDLRSMTDRYIPDAVLELCTRALAKEPERRYADAAQFAIAVADATAPAPPRLSIPPGSPSAPPMSTDGIAAGRGSSPGSHGAPPAVGVRAPSGAGVLYCRAAHLRRAAAFLEAETTTPYLCFAGEEGTGRTCLAIEVAATARAAGYEPCLLRPPLWPLCELGFSAVSAVIAALLRGSFDESALASGDVGQGPLITGGLKIAFATAKIDPSYGPAFLQRAVVAALQWAVERARERARVVMVVDDAHLVDHSSRAVLGEMLGATADGGIRWVFLGRNPAGDLGLSSEASMPIPKLPPDAAAEMAHSRGGQRLASRVVSAIAIEPLTIELAARMPPDREPVTALVSLVTRAFSALSGAEQRTLAAVSTLGEGSAQQIARLLMSEDILDQSLSTLLEWGLVEVDGARILVPHEAVARTARLQVPARLRSELFEAAAALHREMLSPVEIPAALSLRGDLDLAGLVDVEQALKVRRQRGDRAGTVDLLSQALKAARLLGRRGDREAARSARSVFGPQLVRDLVEVGRGAEADRVTAELLSHADDDGIDAGKLGRELARIRSA